MTTIDTVPNPFFPVNGCQSVPNPFEKLIREKEVFDEIIAIGIRCDTCCEKISFNRRPEENPGPGGWQTIDLECFDWFGFEIAKRCLECSDKLQLKTFAKSCGWDGRCIKDYLDRASQCPQTINLGGRSNVYNATTSTGGRPSIADRYPPPGLDPLLDWTHPANPDVFEPHLRIPQEFCCKWAHNNRVVCFGTGIPAGGNGATPEERMNAVKKWPQPIIIGGDVRSILTQTNSSQCPHSGVKSSSSASFSIGGLCRKGNNEVKFVPIPKLWKQHNLIKPGSLLLEEYGFIRSSASFQSTDPNDYHLPETIVDKDNWFPCPDCYPEYWAAAYQMHLSDTSLVKSAKGEDIASLNLRCFIAPPPPNYPSPDSEIIIYKELVPSPLFGHHLHKQDVLLLDKICEQRTEIENLKREMSELKQLIMERLSVPDTKCLESPLLQTI